MAFRGGRPACGMQAAHRAWSQADLRGQAVAARVGAMARDFRAAGIDRIRPVR